MFASDRSPPAGRNVDYYKDDSLTRMLYASDRTVDRAKRGALLAAAQRRIAEMAVEIPLYNTSKVDAVPGTLMGFKGNPTNAGPFWNVYEWQIRSAPGVARGWRVGR
jgi:peptide/nickel transport system substrate-binding protein